ncbi:hypothetical protein [Amycolatopsis plumensis]|uniref:Uncharacterized protein n=1 Tax=Amycolatopsis plumensis TaxID=236508 RepID=A0ABV5U5Z3_9PSEU
MTEIGGLRTYASEELPQSGGTLGILGTSAAVGSMWGSEGAEAGLIDRSTRSVGGSNYGWFGLDGCDRESYGVIKNYGQAASTIDDQLTAMYLNGQRRLRVPIYHRRGPETGTLMDSTGGNLMAQNRRNLADFLSSVRRVGFEEILVAFMPVGENAAHTWTEWREDVYQENWNLVHNLRSIVMGAGIHYRIDLCNEAIPAPSQPMLLAYAQRLWTDYTHVYGRNDTLGFSVIPDPSRIMRIPEVYRGNGPYVYDFHFYPGAGGDEYQRFMAAHVLMNDMGLGRQGWVVGGESLR